MTSNGAAWGRLKCRERDLFAGAEAFASLSRQTGIEKETGRSINHFIVEFLASVLLMYSCVYVPEDGNDFMKQYVPSVVIFIVMLTIKDKAYFCPDGTPMATVVLAVSGAYTDKNGVTDFWDIFVRICAQLSGWLVICFGVVRNNAKLFAFGVPEFKHTMGGEGELAGLSVWFAVFNEFFATLIECIAISFVVMPLLVSYASVDADSAFKSKEEALPPKNKDLWFASVSLGGLHYVLERVFRTTMNPFVFIMHRCVSSFDDVAWVAVVVLVQALALAAACLYCYFLLPSRKVFDHIRQ